MESHSSNILLAIVVLLSAAVIAVPLFKQLGLGSILGYLAAGATVGPWGLGLATEVEQLRHISEFGIVFLLFIIGLELHPQKLWAMRGHVFGIGSAQIMITMVMVGIYLQLRGHDAQVAYLLGAGIALSSTALVLQTLSENGELHSRVGQGTFSILLMQDIAVVPLLAAVPLLSNNPDIATPDILWASLSLIGVLLFTKFIFIPVMGFIAHAKSHDIFAATAVLAVLGAALIMEMNHLSMALGAFLVGLTLSDCDFRHQIEADVKPFKSYLLGLFFMAIGMTLNFAIILDRLGFFLLNILGIFILKGAIIYGLCRLWKFPNREAVRISFLLPQCGEFGFILFGAMYTSGFITEDAFQGLLVLIAMSMMLSPFWEKLSRFLLKLIPEKDDFTDLGMERSPLQTPKVIIIGFGRFGQSIAHLMQEMTIPYLALDARPKIVKQARSGGFEVIFGDATNQNFLKSLDISPDTLIIVTISQKETTQNIVQVVKRIMPTGDILCRAHNLAAQQELIQMGVSEAIPETLEASLRLGEIALWRAGGDFEETAAVLNKCRQQNYQLLRDNTFHT